MQYQSTRGGVSSLSFTQAVMMGLAEDGGLLLPRAIPRINRETFDTWQQLSYPELAFEVMSRFIDDIPASDLKNLIARAYSNFSSEEVTPIIHLGDLHLLELFHGPTLAFKDIALQFLGNVFEYLLERDDQVLNIIGATSGDTGSAAIHGVKGKNRINIFILHPKGRVSPVQEKQMTGVPDENVYNVAVHGTFDDCQAMVKSIFGEVEFKKAYHLGAINSINWARVLAQVVYYIYSTLHITTHEKDLATSFSVPTGNFGDIFAGYIAKKMLPEGIISKLILATNENDILTRFVNDGDYSMQEVVATSSPSMDIQAASNFERYLYYLFDSEPERVKEAMTQFQSTGALDLSGYTEHIKRDFQACAVDHQQVVETINSHHQHHNYLLDPHTAIGVRAALELKKQGVPTVCLATAHPVKFGETVKEATAEDIPLPEDIAQLMQERGRCVEMQSDPEEFKTYISQHGRRSA
ncbi:MAG: threonine synthase [Desulfobulbaceae bacterium]|nr:MAG: threonine synthase [Desulfobulbaceae bacterium]